MTPQLPSKFLAKSPKSKLNYLPLLYFLPKKYIEKCPNLCILPRCYGEIVRSEKWQKLVESDVFELEMLDVTAFLMFQHFGIRGWKEDYTGHFPPWKLSYQIDLWVELLENFSGFGLRTLEKIPDERIAFFAPEYVFSVVEKMARFVLEKLGWQRIFDVVRQHPCHEDFEPRNSRVRRDFLRKWNHYRSKKIKITSLDEMLENDDFSAHEIADFEVNIAENAVFDDFLARFKANLSEKDMKILQLRMDGYTFAEIAKKLGYKNHSGVVKRVKKLAKTYENYENHAF